MEREHEISAAPAAPGTVAPAAEARVDVRALFAHEPRVCLRRMPDRETFEWPDRASAPDRASIPDCASVADRASTDGVPRARMIVKRTRGSPAREDWYERLRGEGVRSPGRREHDNLCALAADGIAVPRAIAWSDGVAPDGARTPCSVVAMELVEHDETLRDAVARAGACERAALARDLLAMVVRLHERGWYHRDLYLQHVLLRVRREVDAAGAESDGPPQVRSASAHERSSPEHARSASQSWRELVLIDVGRARKERAPRARWFVKDLAALLHSTPPSASARERLRFFAAYLDRRGIRARGERRWWLRAVLSKAARMASHVPRFGESRAVTAEDRA